MTEIQLGTGCLATLNLPLVLVVDFPFSFVVYMQLFMRVLLSDSQAFISVRFS